MMGIINMAHGEFMPWAGYVTTYSSHAGLPLALAMLIGAVACGLFGVFLERTIVRRFYHRPIDSLVATWGISLIMTQGTLLLLGSGAPGVGTPFGSFRSAVRRSPSTGSCWWRWPSRCWLASTCYS